MRTRSDIISLLEQNRNKIKNFGVKELGVFGSFARNEQTAESDVDVLVELEQKTFDSYMDLLFFLEVLFERKVDLVMKDTLKPIIKNRILAETIYVPEL
jgi:Predicted nucleotidyltransferases